MKGCIMRRAGPASILFVLLLGCTSGQEQSDGGMEPDSGHVGAGLMFQFQIHPLLSAGGEVGGDFDAIIDEAELSLRDVRAIGDAAPGDERTSAREIDLDWDENDVVELYFAQAPPGLYSQLLADVHDLELEGSVVIDGQDRPFGIYAGFNDVALTISLSGVDLQPGMGLVVPIRVEFDRIVNEIDWEAVPEQEGMLWLDDTSPQIDSVRGKLKEMFSAGSSVPIE
jgi:hypothetical protein